MKRPRKEPTTTPDHFFKHQLKGEQPLSFETAEVLCDLAERFFSFQPWKWLGEFHLVLVPDPVSDEIHSCSVMGALGQVFALTAFLGGEGHRFFQKLFLVP